MIRPDDENARRWVAALTAAFRREDATSARMLVDWHEMYPDAPPPARSATALIDVAPASNDDEDAP